MPIQNKSMLGNHGKIIIGIVAWKLTPFGILKSITTTKAIKEKPKFITAEKLCDKGNMTCGIFVLFNKS